MFRPDLWRTAVVYSLFSVFILGLIFRWQIPLPTRAETGFPKDAPKALSVEWTPDEQINIDIYERVSPAVVNITSTTVEYNWFYEPIPREGIGSGALIDEQGHVVTNHHVVKDAKLVEVTLHDKSELKAKVVGLDPVNDLALLKIDCPE